jgi:hypothetical protein
MNIDLLIKGIEIIKMTSLSSTRERAAQIKNLL